MQIRINKYLSQCNIGSRRKIEEMLWHKEFEVNGGIALPGQLIKTETDKVTHKGKPVKLAETYEYFAVNKPLGYISTTSDEFNRPTVLDLIQHKSRLYPIGRLDQDSTGLMILTNDGDLALKLTHPRYHLPKTYLVTVQERINPIQLKKMSEGVVIQKQKTLPAETKKIDSHTFAIVLHQGMKRQIRQMCNEVSLTVKSLTRIKIGELELGNLQPGEVRKLSNKEISMLKLG